MAEPSLIDYPCDFPIKIMGRSGDDFTRDMVAVVLRHDPDFVAETVGIRASRGGAYLSLTCTVRAVSRIQLDELYRELSAHPAVKIVL